MPRYELVVQRLRPPAIVVHGGAGAYLRSTTPSQRVARGAELLEVARLGHVRLADGARRGVLEAIAELERREGFNAGLGSRLQRDGRCRLSAALMDGRRQRLSAVYNVQGCLHPSALADALQDRPDRNLDGEGAALLMNALAVARHDVRTPRSIRRWQKLVTLGDLADGEAAIGSADDEALLLSRDAPLPPDLRPMDLPPPDERYGTVGAVALDAAGELWACTSTGGRGHEHVGRVSDSPTPAGNYACPAVAVSATGFGEQILDLNVAGRIATRMLDGADLRAALTRTFDEVADAEGLLGVIAIAADGTAGYAHTTEACGVAWVDAERSTHVDLHGRA